MLTEQAGNGEWTLAWFHPIRNFLANKIYHFSRLSHRTGCPIYIGNPLHIISSLFSHFCLFLQNAILHKMLKLGLWNFKLIFFRMQFSLVATFFSIVLVICLGWYFHLKLCHEILLLIPLNIWQWKCKSIRSSHLDLVTWVFGSQMVFPIIQKATKWLVWT